MQKYAVNKFKDYLAVEQIYIKEMNITSLIQRSERNSKTTSKLNLVYKGD